MGKIVSKFLIDFGKKRVIVTPNKLIEFGGGKVIQSAILSKGGEKQEESAAKTI